MTHLSVDELDYAVKIADIIDPTGKTKYILLFLWGTGMRICEFTTIIMDDFDPKKKNII